MVEYKTHVEHTVAITDNGPVVLTAPPDQDWRAQ
jgi:methionine aminopeptidase